MSKPPLATPKHLSDYNAVAPFYCIYCCYIWDTRQRYNYHITPCVLQTDWFYEIVQKLNPTYYHAQHKFPAGRCRCDNEIGEFCLKRAFQPNGYKCSSHKDFQPPTPKKSVHEGLRNRNGEDDIVKKSNQEQIPSNNNSKRKSIKLD